MLNIVIRRFSGAATSLAKPSLASLMAKLRSETGQSFALCKKALEESSMDLDQARSVLSKLVQTQAQNTQTAGLAKDQKQGLVGLKQLSDKSWGLIEMRCISDFVARNPIFVDLANKILNSTSGCKEEASSDIKSKMDELGVTSDLLEAVGKLKEPITVSRLEKIEQAPGQVIGIYIHSPIAPSLGSIASLVCISSLPSKKPWASSLAASIAKHVAGMNPASIDELLQQAFLFKPEMKVEEYLTDVARTEKHPAALNVDKMIRISL